MLTIGNKLYIKGNTNITLPALELLKQLGVTPPKSRSGEGDYGSFYLPEGADPSLVKQLIHCPGTPGSAGRLSIETHS